MVRIGLYAELSSFSHKLNLFMKNILLFFLILLNLGYIPFADLSIYKNPDTFLHNAALLFCIYLFYMFIKKPTIITKQIYFYCALLCILYRGPFHK